MKKIIYLATKSEWGGAQKYIYSLAANLDKSKFEVLVMAGEGSDELFERLKPLGIKTKKLKYMVRAINPLADLLAFFELVGIFRQEKPDIIHLNSSKMGFIGSLVGKWLKIPKIIYTAHGWVFTEPLSNFKKKLYFWLEKTSAKWKKQIITVSEYGKKIAQDNSFKSQIICIHNAINPDETTFYEPEAAKERLNETGRLIGTIANFYPTKGLIYLVKAANLLKKEYPNLKFIIIGDGPEKINLENLITKYNLKENIILKGNIPDAYKYLKAFDLLVLPSVKEGLPYVLLEAIEAGLPIVATKVGGIPEIIDNNFLVEPANSKRLAKKIIEVLDSTTPPCLIKPNFKEFLNKTTSLYLD